MLSDIVSSHEKALDDPAPVVRLHTLNEASVDFVLRPWVMTEDYRDVYWDITRAVKIQFDESNIPWRWQALSLAMTKSADTRKIAWLRDCRSRAFRTDAACRGRSYSTGAAHLVVEDDNFDAVSGTLRESVLDSSPQTVVVDHVKLEQDVMLRPSDTL